ncbi:hypothetical protein EBT25_07575 [bacterium]|nr:hypothetical protein [bacterium]
MIKFLLNLFKKPVAKHSPALAWAQYCVSNPSAPDCRIYDV